MSEVKIEANAQQLATAIRRVVFAADVENSYRRYCLGSVCLDLVDDNRLAAVATDGRRLALTYLDDVGTMGLDEGDRLLIPRKAAKEVASKVTQSAEGTATIDVNGSGVVSWRGYRRKVKEVAFQPAEGRFPKWQDVVPAGLSSTYSKFEAQSDEVLDAIERTDNQPSWLLAWSKADCVLTHKPIDLTKILTHVSGPRSSDCAFDPTYLVGWLRTLPEKIEIKLAFNGESACMCEAPGISTYVFMPQRLER